MPLKVKRDDPLAEQRNDLLIEGRSERFASFTRRQVLNAKQEL
jgi:hypothetical protein